MNLRHSTIQDVPALLPSLVIDDVWMVEERGKPQTAMMENRVYVVREAEDIARNERSSYSADIDLIGMEFLLLH